METARFDYFLPPELIAQEPVEPRDSSRLLVLNRKNGQIEHRTFSSILEYLNEGDCLVLNNTRVIPARLIGRRVDTGGKVEFLLLSEVGKNRWEVLVNPSRRGKVGTEIIFNQALLKGKIEDKTEAGGRLVSFEYEGDFEEILKKVGKVPLPPYIHQSLKDPERYQTIYAMEKGSTAAPTAGLHFTQELMERIIRKGVKIATLTLHIGLDTFRPIKEDNIENHKIHREYFRLPQEVAQIINEAIKNEGRIIAVGTTSTRVLETKAYQVPSARGDKRYLVEAGEGMTSLYIYPGYEFKIVDAIITNFHLPRSTMLVLVSAFAGRSLIFKAYEEAIKKKYRFYSFGDAMLIH